MKSDATDRAALFSRFCDEWNGSSAYIELMARCICAGKDLALVYPDGKTFCRKVSQIVIATITEEPHAHDLLAPYSLEAVYESGYRSLVGTLTEAEDKEFYAAWQSESQAWIRLVEAIARAVPALEDAAYEALSAYFDLRDFTVSFYHGEIPDEDGGSIYEKSTSVRTFIADFLKVEIERREKAENVARLVVKL